MARLTIRCPGCSARLGVGRKRVQQGPITCPRCRKQFVAAVAESPVDIDGRSSVRESAGRDSETISEGRAAFPEIVDDRFLEVPSAGGPRRRRRPGLGAVAVTGVMFCAAIVGLLWWADGLNRNDLVRAVPEHSVSAEEESNRNSVPRKGNRAHAGGRHSGDAGRPADVRPIPLDYLPIAPQLLLHLHPADLWEGSPWHREFMAALGSFAVWFKDQIESATRFAVSEIDELTVAVNFGARTQEPDVVWIVRLKTAVPRSVILQEHIRGTLMPDLPEPVVESGDQAFLLIDTQTVAAAPAELAESLVEARRFPEVPAVEMEQLVKTSNRKAPITIVADLRVLDQHWKLLLAERLHPAVDGIITWLGTDCRVMSWQIDLEPHLKMETRIVPLAETAASVLQGRLMRRLGELPQDMLERVQRMKPRTAGHRILIGRFPAMLQAVYLGSRGVSQDGVTTITTLLPRPAAASLAAAALLTWNETLVRPDRSGPGENAEASVSAPDRLDRQVLVDFRRDPLQESIAYLADAADVTIHIDGMALRLAGFTQNMPQTHRLGRVPLAAALEAIVGQYDGSLVVAESSSPDALLLTTRQAAREQGLRILIPR